MSNMRTMSVAGSKRALEWKQGGPYCRHAVRLWIRLMDDDVSTNKLVEAFLKRLPLEVKYSGEVSMEKSIEQIKKLKNPLEQQSMIKALTPVVNSGAIFGFDPKTDSVISVAELSGNTWFAWERVLKAAPSRAAGCIVIAPLGKKGGSEGEGHVLGVYKKGGVWFVFDPNFGMWECDDSMACAAQLCMLHLLNYEKLVEFEAWLEKR